MVRSNGISDNSVCASRRQACSTRPGVFEDVAFLPNSVAESCFSTWIKGIPARDPGVFVTRAWGNRWPATTEIYRPPYAVPHSEHGELTFVTPFCDDFPQLFDR